MPAAPKPSPLPSPDSANRRLTAGMIFGLMLFYIAVFSAVDLLGFRFPMPVLVSFFLMVAVPFGLVAAGSIYFVYLLRLKLGGRPDKPHPLTLVSAFIGTTVVVTSSFVMVYPEWRQEQLSSWPKLIESAADPSLPKDEVKQLASDVGIVMNRVFGYYEEGDVDAIEADPELIRAFQHVFTAATDNKLDPEEFVLLRSIIPVAQAPLTAPSQAAAPITDAVSP